MSETIIARTLENSAEAIPMDRDAFYREQVEAFKKTGRPTMSVDLVIVFIFNADHELLIQKRSFDKYHNPGLLDKSVSGHVKYGDAPDYTVMLETVQELQIPSLVSPSGTDFEKMQELLKNYLETVAIIEHHYDNVHELTKIIGGEKITIANNVHVYFGLYNGRVRPVDREAKGVMWYSLNELKNEMEKFPETFSDDMRFYMRHLGKEFEDFTKKF